MIWTIPNILTMARILSAPCVALVFVFFERPLADWLAFGLFVGASLTDFFDGWLARKLKQMSEIGKMLDPIADKAMVIIALMVLVMRGNLAGPSAAPASAGDNTVLALIVVPASLIMLRETLISGLREYLGDTKLSVTRLAKWKTTAQMVAIGLLLGVEPLRQLMGGSIAELTPGQAGAPTDAGPGAFAFTTGLMLLWLAAVLTVITGWDYFRKGLAHIRAREVG